MVKVLYFARLRETLGRSEEELAINSGTRVSDLMHTLAQRGDVWQQEFAGSRPVRAALNQELAANDALINEGDEVAFFPPVTGG